MNITPEMMAFAQKQMESMSPEQLAEVRGLCSFSSRCSVLLLSNFDLHCGKTIYTPQMQKMAASMDPSKLAAMGIDPSTAQQAQKEFSNLSPADMARAREQVLQKSTCYTSHDAIVLNSPCLCVADEEHVS